MDQSETRQAMLRACQLAYFLHHDKTTALQIVTDALTRLETAATIQDKRLYYEPTGGWRGARQRGWRNKVWLSELGLLQYLIYLESERYELAKEQQINTIDDATLILHYIKHLVMLTVRRNSFYVTLGISRLLFNYSTTEAVTLYQSVVQDPDRQKFDSYWRDRKLKLMQELKTRFGRMLQLSQERGKETKFQSRQDSSAYTTLVAECFQMFTPWTTDCAVALDFGQTGFFIPALSFSGDSPDGDHHIEMNRMHCILHQPCLERLTHGLGFPPPMERLELPQFFVPSASGGSNPMNEPFDDQDFDAIHQQLNERSRQRRNATPTDICILADGVEQARLNLSRANAFDFDLPADTHLLEVRTIESDLLLANCLVRYDDLAPAAKTQRQVIVLESGQQLSFTFSPSGDDQWNVAVKYEETSLPRVLAIAAQHWQLRLAERFDWQLPGAARLGWTLAMLAVLSLAGLAWWMNSPPKTEQAFIATPIANPTPIEPVSTPTPGKNSPPAGRAKTKPNEPDVFRAPGSTTAINSLGAVKRVFIEVSGGDSSTNTTLHAELMKQLQSASRWQFTNRDVADAMLKVELSTDGTHVTVWLINVDGKTIWPRSNHQRGRRYQGKMDETVQRITADLLAEAQKNQ